MANIGPLELAIVLIIALVVLGPKKLPEMGKSVGRGMREFKDAVTGHHDEPVPAQIVAVTETPVVEGPERKPVDVVTVPAAAAEARNPTVA
jgi:sec-independent protein translocase protein TatA